MRTIDAHRGPILAVAYLPGQRLASAGWDRTVAVWDVAEGIELARHQTTRPVIAVAGSPDGERVAFGDAVTLAVWEPATGAVEPLPGAAVGSLAWSPDGAYLAGAYFDRRFRVWAVRRRDWLPLDRVGVPLKLDFAADGRLLVVGDTAVWLARPPDRATRQPGFGSRRPKRLTTGAISPDGAWVALGGPGGELGVHRLDGKADRTLPGHRGHLFGCAFSADGRLLVTACRDGIVRLWDAATWTERACYDWGISTTRGVAIAPDGMTAVAAGFDGTLLVWDLD